MVIGCVWIVHINGNDLPVGLALVDHGQYAQDLHPDYLTSGTYLASNFTNVNWVVVTTAASVFVTVSWVFPCLKQIKG